MDYIWNELSKQKTDEEKLKKLREIREGMKWGNRQEGVPQLSETTLFLLKIIDGKSNQEVN